MAEQWIDASTALELAGDSFAICGRLNAGILSSRARLLTVGDSRVENTLIPAKFWWAGGYEAIDQNWQVGDFSTWIDSKEHWQAFGVTFALSGLLEMLPFERRGIVARSVSVASNPDWISAAETRRFCHEEAGEHMSIAGRAAVSLAKLGFLTARAVLAQGAQSDTAGARYTWEAREWDVANWFWESFTGANSSSQSWELGKFSGRGMGPNGLRTVTLTGVYFLRESLNALLPAAQPSINVVSVPKNVGGRPPIAFSDDLLCAIWKAIYQGDFKPARQAEVERAMLDWANANGHELGATVAREKARKVFAAYSA